MNPACQTYGYAYLQKLLPFHPPEQLGILRLVNCRRCVRLRLASVIATPYFREGHWQMGLRRMITLPGVLY
jgi:hypothetical protein